MFKPPSPVTMAAKSSASVFTGRVKVNRLIQVQGYRFFAIDLPKDGCWNPQAVVAHWAFGKKVTAVQYSNTRSRRLVSPSSVGGIAGRAFWWKGAGEVAESLRCCGRFSPCRWQTRADLCSFPILACSHYPSSIIDCVDEMSAGIKAWNEYWNIILLEFQQSSTEKEWEHVEMVCLKVVL